MPTVATSQQTTEARSHLAQALALMERAVPSDPQTPRPLQDAADRGLESGAVTPATQALRTLALSLSASDEALRQVARSLAQNAANPDFFFNLAEALRAEGRHEMAAVNYHRVLQIDPHHAQALSGLGHALEQLGRTADAIAHYRQALEVRPDCPATHARLAKLLASRGDYDLAVLHLQTLVKQSPQDPAPHALLGELYQLMGRTEQAAALYAQAASLCPWDADARLLRAELALQRGDWETGWREFQWRRQARPQQTWRLDPRTAWNGENLDHTHLHVHSEQNAALDVLFASCLPSVVQTAKRVTVECHPRLVRLFQTSFPTAEVISGAQGQQSCLAGHANAAHVLMGTLPRYLRRRDADFPQHEGYLGAPAELRRAWRKKLAELGTMPKIGLCWRSRPAQCPTPPSEFWRRILRMNNAQFIALQPDLQPEQVQALNARWDVRLHRLEGTADIDDLANRAALMTELDLVIAVPGTTAHLAGALGKPGLILLPPLPSWTWGLRGPQTPWYPSLRLLRQSHANDWDDALGEVLRVIEMGPKQVHAPR